MTAENFCYWLKGYFEINDNQPRVPEHLDSLNSEQIKMIKEHLNYVFQPTLVQISESAVKDTTSFYKTDLPSSGTITIPGSVKSYC